MTNKEDGAYAHVVFVLYNKQHWFIAGSWEMAIVNIDS